MKYKVVAETVRGTGKSDRTVLTMETNRTDAIGEFVRNRVHRFRDREHGEPFSRVVLVEMEGVVVNFPEEGWDDACEEWLRKNDWF